MYEPQYFPVVKFKRYVKQYILLEHSLANMIDNSRLYIVDIKLSLTNPTVAYMYLELSRANAK